VDRGQLRQLAAATILPNGKRIPGLKLDHPRQLALMHALVRFTNIAAGNTFTTSELHVPTAEARLQPVRIYSFFAPLRSLQTQSPRGLVEKIPRSRRYRLFPQGYSICLLFLKLFERIYAPLTAGLLRPFSPDAKMHELRRSQLDRLYARVISSLDKLLQAVGLKAV
jgi:hypothetical protein